MFVTNVLLTMTLVTYVSTDLIVGVVFIYHDLFAYLWLIFHVVRKNVFVVLKKSRVWLFVFNLNQWIGLANCCLIWWNDLLEFKWSWLRIPLVIPGRLLETDSKSLRSVNGSRRNSGSSLVSSSSASSNLSHLEEDSWILWGRIVNDWDEVRKKKEKQLKVRAHSS